jgi:hypothetical protein
VTARSHKHPQRGPCDIVFAELRGAREDDFWKQLLPKARQRVVDAGLFTPDGTLTDRGRQEMKRGISYVLRILTVVILFVTAVSSAAAASQCLHSAQAVKHAFPGSWPSWTGRQAGHKGEHCWFPASVKVAKPVTTGQAPRSVKTTVVAPPNENTELARTMGSLGWTFRSRTAVIGPVASLGLFRDRFPVPSDLSSISRPSILQRLMDPTGVVP